MSDRRNDEYSRRLEERRQAAAPLAGRLRLAPHEPAARRTAVCGYCAIGCSFEVRQVPGRPPVLAPDASYPVNTGGGCSKGWESLAPLTAPDRATVPLLRGPDGERRPVSWDEALGALVDRFRRIKTRHGAGALAFLSTGQIATEEMAFLGALAKFGMGIVNADANTRQCMATSAVAYREAYGFDAPPYTYRDLEESDVVVLWGSNLAVAHPVLWERLQRSRRAPTVVVVDPRKTVTASAATLHLPLQPKSDLALLYAIANVLIRNDWIDGAFVEAHTEGFAAFKEHVQRHTVTRAVAATGLPAEKIEQLAELCRPGRNVSFWWTMGVNQSHEGTRTAQAIINLSLLGGHVGRPGTGANSITGQCNAMGARLFSNTATLLGGHDYTRPEHRRKVAAAIGVDESQIPTTSGATYDEIVKGIETGAIRGLWIVGTNPAHSWIDQEAFRKAVAKLDFLVVQDMYASTETAQLADLVLPAASWGEKEGTFINSERRIGLIRPLVPPPGEALTDFEIFRRVAEAWGCGELFADWSSPERVFRRLAALTEGQPCDISGIDGYDAIDRAGGIQWPFPKGAQAEVPERRLFEDGRFFHEDGRARFLFEDPRPVPEATTREFPYLLLTGRGVTHQWHTQTRTKRSPSLWKRSPQELYVEISPLDARSRGITPEAWVQISSRRGAIQARALVTNAVKPGQLFLPMHFEAVNKLTLSAFDPYARQPAYKACAVKLTPMR